MGLAAPTRPLKIVVIDDHSLMRQGLRMLVESHAGFWVVGEAHDRATALPLVTREQPDIILLDLDLGAENGLDLIRDMLAAAPAARVLVLTGVRDTAVRRSAFLLGARGLVEKEAAAEELVAAIDKVSAGEVWIDRTVMASVLTEVARPPEVQAIDPEAAKIAQLSARELQVTGLIGEGLSNKRIAGRLAISETTVRHHLTSIFGKLEVRDRLELLIYAYRNKLVDPPGAA